MCYKSPGPRCSSYAMTQLRKAVHAQMDAEKSNDYASWEKAVEKRDEAAFMFYMTPAGQKNLEKKIERGVPNATALADMKEKARAARVEALKGIGINKDENKDVSFSHHDGTRDPKAPRQISFDPDAVRVNDADFPHPQANRLDKVSTTVDAINGGATTISAIAQTLDVVDRQGSYYSDAAGYLGLVEEVGGGDFKEYSLTSLGQEFARAEPAERENLLRQQIAGMPLMQVYVEEGAGAAKDFMQQTSKVGDATVERRLTTLEAWSKTLKGNEFSNMIASDQRDGQTRVISAAEYAEEQRKKRANRSSGPLQGNPCPSCHQQMPLTNKCDDCDG